MNALTGRQPNSVNQKIKELAAPDQISVNQFVASVASEKMASVMTLDDLRSEAAKGNGPDFENYFKLVPDMPARIGDEKVLASKGSVHPCLGCNASKFGRRKSCSAERGT